MAAIWIFKRTMPISFFHIYSIYRLTLRGLIFFQILWGHLTDFFCDTDIYKIGFIFLDWTNVLSLAALWTIRQSSFSKTWAEKKNLRKKMGLLGKIKQIIITFGLSLCPFLTHGKTMNWEKGIVAYTYMTHLGQCPFWL